MMLMNRFARLKPGMLYIIALCVLVPTVILPATYFAQTQGVCLKAGRVLSEEELRKAVLTDIVNNSIKTAFRDNWESGNDYYWVGINSPAQETNLRKLLDASYNNGKSIEENFGLKLLLEGRNHGKYETVTSNQLIEPFILMVYEPRNNGSAFYFNSENARRVSFQELTEKRKETINPKIGVYEILLGYGNYYFRFGPPIFTTLSRECCDNRDQSSKEYLEKKREAYERAVSSMTTLSEIMDVIPSIAAISNCGDILTSKDHVIRLVDNEFEDEPLP
jgi:hypothetical protein